MDVLSASYYGDKLSWYENLGSGSFGPEQIITTAAAGAASVFATDLDGDGDPDVLSASQGDDKIAWHENLGAGSFGPQQIITTVSLALEAYAADLDGDGDQDVLFASNGSSEVGYCENLGAGSFGIPQVITTNAPGAYSVYASDLDLDGDLDVLSASAGGSGHIAWYENNDVTIPCSIYTNANLGIFSALAVTARSNYTIPIPSSVALIGYELTAQGMAAHPATSLSFATSNGVTIKIGQ